MRVLVAEHDAARSGGAREALTGTDFDVVSAHDGLRAWEVLQGEDAPEVAVVDGSLSGLDGIELCRRVKGHPGSTDRYLILLTERGEDVVAGLEVGADDSVAKPITPDELRARVRAGARVIDRRRAAAERFEEAERARQEHETILVAASEPIVRVDADGVVRFINPAAARLVGGSPEKLLGRPLHDLVHHSRPDGTPYPPDACPILAVLQDGRQRAEKTEVFWRQDGDFFPVAVTSTPIHDHRGIAGAVVTFQDVTERRAAEDALTEQAIRDTLTGLYNRRTFAERVDTELARASRHGHTLALLLCDLDEFKLVNDRWGHEVGDQVIKGVARSIQESTRGTDLIFRWGGDEIVIVLADTTRAGVTIAGQRIKDHVNILTLPDDRLHIDMSIGVALYPDHGQNADELVRSADRALYLAKHSRGRIQVGVDEYDLSEDSVAVALQPIWSGDATEVHGHEVLTRDARGNLSPQDLFRRYQTLGRLGEFKIMCFRTQLDAVQRLGLTRAFLNVDLGMLGLMEAVDAPKEVDVVLEIPVREGAADLAKDLALVAAWRARGFRFLIDNYRGGFGSLSFLAEMEPDYIKIGRASLVEALSSESSMRCFGDLLSALRGYAGLALIAGGVETAEELERVRELGIELVQGYLLGRPILATQLSADVPL